jgi:hypothetical protein
MMIFAIVVSFSQFWAHGMRPRIVCLVYDMAKIKTGDSNMPGACAADDG